MSIETSESVKHISAALLAFQGETDGVKRDAANPHFKSRYTSLEAVVDYARPALQRNGLVFTQAPGRVVDGALELTTRITHAESGEWQQSTMHIPLAKKDPQGAGSALTYAQRYSLMATLGLPPTDDDAESAIDRNNTRQEPAKATPAVDDNARTIADVLISAADQAKTLDAFKDWKIGQNGKITELPEFERKRVNRHLKEVYDRLLADEPVNTLEAG
ncbi:ERF family protein [Roseibium sp.]|uniref:ERF family protein n=1 Tax=Roseibium sp. TaxID=1936156 RepID=UPI0032879D55